MPIHHKRGVRGYQTTRCFQIQFWRRQFKTCPPSPNPSSSLKVKAVKKPTMPYMVIVTSMVKAVTKCIHKTCDDQQDHTRWRWMFTIIMNHRYINQNRKLLQYKCAMELNVKEHQSTIDKCSKIWEELN